MIKTFPFDALHVKQMTIQFFFSRQNMATKAKLVVPCTKRGALCPSLPRSARFVCSVLSMRASKKKAFFRIVCFKNKTLIILLLHMHHRIKNRRWSPIQVGKNKRANALLRETNLLSDFKAYHCLLHQQSFCAKHAADLQLKTFTTVVKIIFVL